MAALLIDASPVAVGGSSLELHAAGRDDAGPALLLAFEEGCEFGRRHGVDLGALDRELRTDLGRTDDARELGVEAGDDLRRRALRDEQALPGARFEAGHALL